MDDLYFLDVGCGNGYCTRIIAEYLENPKQVMGIEYSHNRLLHCKKMNSSIEYIYGDITKSFLFNRRFDAVLAMDVFMHLKQEVDILAALRNINENLYDGAIFMWYECNTDSHFCDVDSDSDGRGYSIKEMDDYCKITGFNLIKKYGLYRKLPFVGSTYYMAKTGMYCLLDFINMIVPLPRGNNVRIYRKESSCALL